MKTLSLTVGLLLMLFIVYYGDAAAHGVKPTPDLCCFKFYDRRIPVKQIDSIKKTHSKCTIPAFVIKTPRADFCVRQTETWALNVFVKRHN